MLVILDEVIRGSTQQKRSYRSVSTLKTYLSSFLTVFLSLNGPNVHVRDQVPLDPATARSRLSTRSRMKFAFICTSKLGVQIPSPAPIRLSHDTKILTFR